MSEQLASKRFQTGRDEINSVSPSFCMAKWLQVTIHLQHGNNHSCHHPAMHHTSLEELEKNPSALHNSNYKKLRRKEMLEGKRPSECSYCWAVEDSDTNAFSDRVLKSIDHWSYDYIDKVKNLPWDANIAPHYLEVSFGNECNLACSYCTPDISSKIFTELKKEGPFPSKHAVTMDYLESSNRIPISRNEKNPYVEAFWKWFPDISNELHVFRITGGEPLINKNTFLVLDHMKANPNPKLELSVNSNFCISDLAFDKYIKQSKELLDLKAAQKIITFTSVDTAGSQAEYIRDGLDYAKLLKNMNKYLRSDKRFYLTVMVTFNIFSPPMFKEFLKDIFELKLELDKDGLLESIDSPRLSIDISILHFPIYLNVINLPKSWLPVLEESLQFMKERDMDIIGKVGFSIYDINKMERLVDWFKSTDVDNNELSERRVDFYEFVDEYDRRRGKNFLNSFPEYSKFYKTCKGSSL